MRRRRVYVLLAASAAFFVLAIGAAATNVDNLDDLAAAITSSNNSANMQRIRAYAVAQAAATQSQEQAIRDLQARVAALEGAAPPPPPPPAAACANGADDDGDGKTDYPADPGCSSSSDTDETDPAPPPPPTSGFPDATNTGVPAGTVLTAYTGPMTVTTANTVIDSKTITGCMEIRASNVTIKNSLVRGCNGSALYLSAGPGWNNWSATVLDTTIDCGLRAGSAAISHGFFTVRRANIIGCENGLSIDRDIDIRDSYIHDMLEGGGSHSDGIQLASHYDPPGTSNIVEGSLNVTIVHNTIMSMRGGAHTPEPDASYYTTSAIITNDVISDTNILIQDNLLAGGSYTLYCHDNGAANNVRIINNRFSTRYKATVGYFGPTNHSCSDEAAWTGNVYHESGAPIPNG